MCIKNLDAQGKNSRVLTSLSAVFETNQDHKKEENKEKGKQYRETGNEGQVCQKITARHGKEREGENKSSGRGK